MLLRGNSPTQFHGDLVEHECPRCHRAVELPFGMLCRACRDEIDRKAIRLGNRVALAVTILLGIWIYFFRRPADPAARLVSGMSVAITFVLVNIVVRRATREMSR